MYIGTPDDLIRFLIRCRYSVNEAHSASFTIPGRITETGRMTTDTTFYEQFSEEEVAAGKTTILDAFCKLYEKYDAYYSGQYEKYYPTKEFDSLNQILLAHEELANTAKRFQDTEIYVSSAFEINPDFPSTKSVLNYINMHRDDLLQTLDNLCPKAPDGYISVKEKLEEVLDKLPIPDWAKFDIDEDWFMGDTIDESLCTISSNWIQDRYINLSDVINRFQTMDMEVFGIWEKNLKVHPSLNEFDMDSSPTWGYLSRLQDDYTYDSLNYRLPELTIAYSLLSLPATCYALSNEAYAILQDVAKQADQADKFDNSFDTYYERFLDASGIKKLAKTEPLVNKVFLSRKGCQMVNVMGYEEAYAKSHSVKKEAGRGLSELAQNARAASAALAGEDKSTGLEETR